MSIATNLQPHSPSQHILELTTDALRVARAASVAAAEAIAVSANDALRQLRQCEKELDSLDRDVDDLVTGTITGVAEGQTRELLACMKVVISLERIGDLLLSFGNRAEAIAARAHTDDVRELTFMTTRLEMMLKDVETAFRERSLDLAVTVLRADSELDRLRNLVVLRHLEPSGDARQDSFHVISMAQELERAGDHVKNIAEEICHLVSGRTVRHVLRTYDRSEEQLFLAHIRAKAFSK